MSDAIEQFLNEQKSMLKLVDEILGAWNYGQGCYQLPALIGALSLRLNWDSEQARRNDPIIRAYLKDHPTWYVRRGANGGVMERSEHEKKEAAKQAKEIAKQEIRLALAAKLAQPATSLSVEPNNTNSSVE
jgi:hypothetical protein